MHLILHETITMRERNIEKRPAPGSSLEGSFHSGRTVRDRCYGSMEFVRTKLYNSCLNAETIVQLDVEKRFYGEDYDQRL